MNTKNKTTDNTDFRGIFEYEPDWLYHRRHNSWGTFTDGPLPDRVVHLWRYTKPEHFLLTDPGILMASRPRISLDNPIDTLIDSDRYAATASRSEDNLPQLEISPELNKTGIIFSDLLSATVLHNELTEPYLGQLVGSDFGTFEAMNMALWNDGLFLYIPDNLTVDRPIYLRRRPADFDSASRLLVIVGRNAEATIIDEYTAAAGTDGSFNGAVEIFADDYSRVRYVNLQNMPLGYKTYLTERARIGRETSLYTIFGGLGSSVAKVNAGTILTGPGGNSRMYGVVFADGKQHLDYHTLHHHRADDSYSNIDFKVVLKDKATSAYTGLIKIDQDTRNCEAYQLNRNLLLNKGPRAESIPELEILTDEVRCSHGATMGPIDKEMLFYLMSRGLDRDEAVKTVIKGFIEPTAAQLPVGLRETMRRLVLTKLEGQNQ